MKRLTVAFAVLVLACMSLLWVTDVSARAGGGSSGGSRGSRSYSAPARPSPGQVSPSRPVAPPSPALAPPVPQRSGWGGMLGGLLLGGLLGGLLFGGGFGGGHGLLGGFGLLEILVIGGLILFGISWMRRRQTEAAGAPAYAGGYNLGGGWQSSERSAPVATIEAPVEPSDVDRGLGHIRQMDAGFDAARFAEEATDIFFKIQAAWTTRNMARVDDLLTPEMRGELDRQCERLRSEQRINRLENIAVRQATVTEAWQEKGMDYVTVYFLASLLDYTTDESGSRVLEGSTTEPVKFEEYWTFVRPVGPNRFKLSAIQQA